MENEKNGWNKINWKNILIGVLIGAVLIIIVVIAFWYFTRPKGTTTSPTTTKTATPSAKNDETTGWKTYQDKDCGFQVKYPTDFNEYASEGGVTFESKKWEGYEGHHSYISVAVEETNLSALEWLDRHKIYGPIVREPDGKVYVYSGAGGERTKELVENITIGGEQAIKFYWWGVSGGGDNIVVKSKNKPSLLYHIHRHLAGPLENPEETVPKELFNQMLSTFQFLD